MQKTLSWKSILLFISFATMVLSCSSAPKFIQDGIASWYGENFHGRPTASGEPYDMYQLTAAHRTLPFGTRVLVTCPSTGKSVNVRINDRGPYAGGRVIDLSYQAARELGIVQKGTVAVRLVVHERRPASSDK